MEGPEKEIFEEDEAADIGKLSINSQMEVQSTDKKLVEAEESSQALVQPQSQGLTASQQIVSQFQGYYNTYKRKVVRGPPWIHWRTSMWAHSRRSGQGTRQRVTALYLCTK